MSAAAPHTCRPRQHVEAFGRRYPGAWAQAETFRASRGELGMPDWPEWCYLPLAGGVVPPNRGADIGALGAILAWRMTQGIYRFDPAVYKAVRETPVMGDIPHEVLFRLPEWCVYVETPDLQHPALGRVYGAFAHLEWDVNESRAELRLVLDLENALVPVPLHLGPWSLEESLRRMDSETLRVSGYSMPTQAMEATRAICEPLVSLLLYLCSQAADIGDGPRRPINPSPKKTKRGMRLFAADRPTTWDVGVRLGAELRRAYAASEGQGGGTHAGPRAHIRRAHWHGFWKGPRQGERQFDLRWMPPIAVNLEAIEQLPAVVRAIK